MRSKKIWGMILLTALFAFIYENSENDRIKTKHSSGESGKASNNQPQAQSSKPMPIQSVRVPATTRTISSEEEFQKAFPGKWRFRRDEIGKIRTLTGGNIPAIAKSSESLISLAEKISPLLANGNYQFSSDVIDASETKYLKVNEVQQKVGDFRVYQGTIGFVSNHRGDIYIINNRIKDITEFDPTPSLDQHQASASLQRHYPDASLTLKDGPLVFSNNRSASRLAWIFLVRAETPKRLRREIAVSADTGEILHEEDRLIQD